MPKTKGSAPDVGIAAEVQAAAKAMAPAVKRLKKALGGLDPAKLPVGAVSDMLYDLRAIGKQLNAIVDPVGDLIGPAIKELEEFFVNNLRIGEASGVQGGHSRTQITDSVVPQVEDWSRLWTYIRRTNSFDLLNKAVNREAWRERLENKKQVPGVVAFHHKKVSSTKLNGKGGAA